MAGCGGSHSDGCLVRLRPRRPARTTTFTPNSGGGRSPGQADDAVGYIFLLAAPLHENAHCKLVDLRLKASNWLRPHVQQGFAVSMSDPLRASGRIDELHVATFIVPRPQLRSWSSYDTLGPEVMYSNAEEDQGLYYWRRSATLLKAQLSP